MNTPAQNQPSIQNYFSIERQVIERIENFSRQCLMDFDRFTLPGENENQPPFILHLINHLIDAERELKKVNEFCLNFLCDSKKLTPDEVSILKESASAELKKIDESNKVLTEKIDSKPFLVLIEKIIPAKEFIEAEKEAHSSDELPF